MENDEHEKHEMLDTRRTKIVGNQDPQSRLGKRLTPGTLGAGGSGYAYGAINVNV